MVKIDFLYIAILGIALHLNGRMDGLTANIFKNHFGVAREDPFLSNCSLRRTIFVTSLRMNLFELRLGVALLLIKIADK